MDNIFQEIANLDKLVHEPARLSILTALMACETADFIFLQRLTGLTAGNLSVHLAKLEDSGLLLTEKRFLHKRPNTVASLTEEGLTTIQHYWERMETLRSAARNTNDLD